MPLLTESGGHLLLESGGDLLLESDSGGPVTVPAGACNCCTDCTGELLVADNADVMQSWHRLGMCLTDLSPLWEEPLQRGVNVVLPGIGGRLEMPRWADETDYALHLIVSGVVIVSGDGTDGDLTDPAVGENEQLRRNLAFIRANMLNPVPPATRRAAQLVSPDGATTLTGFVQYGPQPLMRSYKDDGLWIGTLHLVVPAGAFS